MDNKQVRDIALGAVETLIDMVIPKDEPTKDTPWAGAKPYDGESLGMDLSEEEANGLMAALEDSDANAVLVPIDRDWAMSFLHNIRREERRLAAERLRVRLSRSMFAPSFVESLTETVDPPETPRDVSPFHQHDEWCVPDCSLPTDPSLGAK